MFTKSQTTPKPNNQPTHHAYYVAGAKDGEKGRWLKLGAFFPHEDGHGGTVVLEVMPLGEFDGRIVLRTPSPKADKA